MCGKDGRRPFPPNLEAAISKELRKKATWPCFSDMDDPKVLNIGKKGFRHQGFHEFQKLNKSVAKVILPEELAVPLKKTPAAVREHGKLRQLYSVLFTQQESSPREDLEIDERKELKNTSLLIKEETTTSLAKRGWSGTIPTLEEPRFATGGKPETLLKKRRKLALPAVYVNCLAEDSKIDNVMYYDPGGDAFSMFKMKSEAMSYSPVDGCVEHGFEQVIRQEILQDDEFCTNAVAGSPFSEVEFELEGFSPDDDLPMHFPETMSNNYDFMASSVLDTFEDVSSEEVAVVVHLRALTKPIFEEYYKNQERPESLLHFQEAGVPPELPRDVCGDVKLLRILRTCQGDLSLAVSEVRALLHWRQAWGVDAIRKNLLAGNMSIETLKKAFTIGKDGGCYPFFSQDENGDITDIWVVKAQTEEDEGEMEDDLLSHIKLFEFRAIVLDCLSYMKRRVVGYKVILDCSAIKDEHVVDHRGFDFNSQAEQPLVTENTKWKVNWWQMLKT